MAQTKVTVNLKEQSWNESPYKLHHSPGVSLLEGNVLVCTFLPSFLPTFFFLIFLSNIYLFSIIYLSF